MCEGKKNPPKLNNKLKIKCNPPVTQGNTEKWIQGDFSCENWELLSVQCLMWVSAGADPSSHCSLRASPAWPWVWQGSAQPSPRDALRHCPGMQGSVQGRGGAQPRMGKVSAGLGAAGVLPQNSSIPNSPACSWLPGCLETRKLTESHTSMMSTHRACAGQQSSQQHCSKYFTATAFTMEKSASWKLTV